LDLFDHFERGFFQTTLANYVFEQSKKSKKNRFFFCVQPLGGLRRLQLSPASRPLATNKKEWRG